MTTMFEPFFGIPQSVVRLGKLKNLTGFASKLYLALCHESERRMTRELVLTVSQLRTLVGGSRNSHTDARTRLVRAGLVQAESYGVDGYVFHLCNPETGEPWPSHPRERITYRPKGNALTVRTGEDSKVTKRKRPPKSEFAGTKFPFGHKPSTEGTSSIPVAGREIVISPLTWDEIGN